MDSDASRFGNIRFVHVMSAVDFEFKLNQVELQQLKNQILSKLNEQFSALAMTEVVGLQNIWVLGSSWMFRSVSACSFIRPIFWHWRCVRLKRYVEHRKLLISVKCYFQRLVKLRNVAHDKMKFGWLHFIDSEYVLKMLFTFQVFPYRFPSFPIST